ncbi:MAG: hypothetical protein Q8Q39_01435, partial [bacterium]|nr:hypothetical protein [bacterium]
NFSIREVCRVLKPGGMLWITSPCILPESREPHDYARYTTEGLERLMRAGGFKNLLLIPIGERFSAACHLISPLMPRFIRLVAFPIALVLDRCIPRKLKRERPAPIGYFCMAKKPESF